MFEIRITGNTAEEIQAQLNDLTNAFRKDVEAVKKHNEKVKAAKVEEPKAEKPKAEKTKAEKPKGITLEEARPTIIEFGKKSKENQKLIFNFLKERGHENIMALTSDEIEELLEVIHNAE